jgi:outer membrane receptor protein involved in Fe transport
MKVRLGLLAAAIGAGTASVGAVAAPAGDQAIEEVVVTGSYIRGTPEDAPSPVDVLNRDDLTNAGSPSMVDLIKGLSVSSGVDGETNQFTSNGIEGSANVNLRGLGPARTLVLINGRRQTVSPFGIGENGQLFVNTNAIPTQAIQRVEVLKEGAGATYGSDAIAGVVNFITRSDFRGLEISGEYKDIQDSDGTYDLGATLGLGTDTVDWVTTVAWRKRNELKARDRDYIFDAPVASATGYSVISNPGTFIPLSDPSLANLTPDPDCEAVGNEVAGGFCNFRFTPFDNLIEREKHLQAFSELNVALGDAHEFHAEVLYANNEVPEWNTSPSYPPQVLVNPQQAVVPGMPHYDDWLARNPQLTDATGPDFSQGALFIGRAFGASGPAQTGSREYDTLRLAADVSGFVMDGEIGYDVGVSWSEATAERTTPDIFVNRFNLAFRGLGGPACDPATGTPGVGDCEFYNPFVSAIENSAVPGASGGNPAFDPALANSESLRNWLYGGVGRENTTELLVFDAVVDGSAFELAGGEAQWAAGVQWREEKFELDPNAVTDLTQNPCIRPGQQVGDPGCPSATGPFGFLAGAFPFEDDQDIVALFGEMKLPVLENLDVQVALRYEDYGGDVGDTIDPKVAMRWDVTDWATVRASASSTFKGPTLNQLGGQSTTLTFIGAAGAFKAVDTSGNPDLQPEEANAFNFGVILNPTDTITASVDFWRFDFEKPIVREPFEPILDAFAAGNPAAADRLSPAGLQDVSNVERIDVRFVNGPDITTQGVDFEATWDLASDYGLWTLGTQGTWTETYDVDSFEFLPGVTQPAFDGAGHLNRSRLGIVRALPDLKMKAYLNFNRDRHNARLIANHVNEYQDERYELGAPPTTTGFGADIDAHTTFDLVYNFTFNEGRTRLSATVFNLTDEDPPESAQELTYDPYTHNAFGRMWKVGVTHTFDGLLGAR